MTTTTIEPNTITPARAEVLGTTIETFGKNLNVPLDVSPRIDRETDQVTRFDVELLVPVAEIPTGIGTNETARSIAKHLDQVGIRLKSLAQAIRMRYPQ